MTPPQGRETGRLRAHRREGSCRDHPLRGDRLPARSRGTRRRRRSRSRRGRTGSSCGRRRCPGRTWNANEPYSAEEPKPLTYIWSDRGIYRPGKRCPLPASTGTSRWGGSPPSQGKFRVDLINGSDESQPAGSVSGAVSASGSFSGQIVLPKDAEPGDWLLSFHRIAGKSDTTDRCRVRAGGEFPPCRFLRGPAACPKQRAFMGGTLDARFSGSYLAGGTVTRGKWSWFWTRRETWYQPPGRCARGLHIRRRGEGLGGGHGIRFRLASAAPG